MNKKIKVKSSSQNNRKKIKRGNLNNTFKDSDILENIIRMSNPNKKSKSKLNQTLIFYRPGGNHSQVKYSKKDYLNQNTRSKKKGLNYMKQMMNKTALIQNQDYQAHNRTIKDFKGAKMRKKNLNMIKNDLMVREKLLTIR